MLVIKAFDGIEKELATQKKCKLKASPLKVFDRTSWLCRCSLVRF